MREILEMRREESEMIGKLENGDVFHRNGP